MTERRRAARPRSGPVFWASILLFAVLFALLTYRLASESGPAVGAPRVEVRKVIQRRVVTTVVPTPGPNSVSRGPTTSSGGFVPVAEPVVTSAS
jgi:hypothetical protein